MTISNPMVEQVLGAVNDSFSTLKKSFSEDVDTLKGRIETLEAYGNRPTAPGTSGNFTADAREHNEKFCAWLRRPTDGSLKRQLDEAQSEIENKASREGKAVTVASAAGGGYAVPEILDSQIESRVRLLNPFRSLVRTVEVGSRDWKALVSRNDSTSGWVAESGSRSETSTSELRERAPTFGTLYAYPKATEEAVQDIFFNVAEWLVQEAADGFAAAEATAIISGDGSSKPTGFLHATPVTTTDAASPERAAGALQYLPFLGNSPLAPTADALIDLSMSIKERYLLDAPRVAWVMSRATAATVRKLKDSYGSYLWQPGLTAGQPATLLGYPVALTDAMPAATSNQFPIAFGNWARGYVLADRIGTMRIVHDDNITSPGFHRWYIRRVVGGCVYNHEAVKLLKYAGS